MPIKLKLCPISSQSLDDAVQGTGSNQHNYVGAGWVHAGGIPGFYLNTLSYSAAAGNYVTLTFFGNKFEWYAERKIRTA